MMRKKLIALGTACMLLLTSLTPAFAATTSTDKILDQFEASSDDYTILGKNALTVKKTKSGTLYWDCTPQEMMQAISTQSITWNVIETNQTDIKSSDYKKVKNKNVFRFTKDQMKIDIYATSGSVSDGRVTKVVLSIANDRKVSDELLDEFAIFSIIIVDIFAGYDYDSRVAILDKLIGSTKKNGAQAAVSYATATYQMNFGSKDISMTITPKLKQ